MQCNGFLLRTKHRTEFMRKTSGQTPNVLGTPLREEVRSSLSLPRMVGALCYSNTPSG